MIPQFADLFPTLRADVLYSQMNSVFVHGEIVFLGEPLATISTHVLFEILVHGQGVLVQSLEPAAAFGAHLLDL